MAQRPSKNTFAESYYFFRWLWALEHRRGQTLPGTLLFISLIGLLIGLLKKRDLVPTAALPALFWLSYLFTLFQAIPKSFLDISPESWRWLRLIVSPGGASGGLLTYILTWAGGLWGIWYGLSAVLWDYVPPPVSLLTAFSLGLVVGIGAFLTAMARLSYATASILSLPLTLMPLLLALFRSEALMENLLYLATALTLTWSLLPLLWET
mgnify:CR=1 FL=1